MSLKFDIELAIASVKLDVMYGDSGQTRLVLDRVMAICCLLSLLYKLKAIGDAVGGDYGFSIEGFEERHRKYK